MSIVMVSALINEQPNETRDTPYIYLIIFKFCRPGMELKCQVDK